MTFLTLNLRPEIAAHLEAQARGQRVSVAVWIADRLADHAGLSRAAKSPVAHRPSDAAVDQDRAARIKRHAADLAAIGRVRPARTPK